MKINDFENIITSLKEASRDDRDRTNVSYMSHLNNEVIDFDAVKDKYLSMLNPKPTQTPLSNDALFRNGDEWYFVEFKNGTINNRVNAEIKIKIYDSILMFLEQMEETIDFSRKKVNYILVFNEESVSKKCISKQFDENEYLKYNQIPSDDSASLADITSLLDDLSGEFGRPQFGLEGYENFIFKKVLTIPKYRFDNYILQFFK